jgi:hypothetical protein
MGLMQVAQGGKGVAEGGSRKKPCPEARNGSGLGLQRAKQWAALRPNQGQQAHVGCMHCTPAAAHNAEKEAAGDEYTKT